MDKDRPRYVSSEESRIWASRFYVAVPAPLWEGCCCTARVHFGLGKVPHSSIAACAHWHTRTRAVFLPSENVSLLLPCQGEIMYSRKKTREVLHVWENPANSENELKFTIVFNFIWHLVPWKVLPNSFYKTNFKETCFDLNIDNALKFYNCQTESQTLKPKEFFTFLLTCQPHC